MSTILVSGLINIETTLRVENFPIVYTPVRYPFFGVDSSVSGVGYNIARALTMLGDQVRLLSIIGRDPAANLVRNAMEKDHISAKDVIDPVERTAQSVILYDGEGRRQINVDLKDVQDTEYPVDRYRHAASGSDLLVLCNVNYSRPFLDLARKSGKRVATDVHAINNLDDPYNADFMRAANILFMSSEYLSITPEEWAERVWERFNPEVLVIAMSKKGALLGLKKEGTLERIPAVDTRPVVNTIGAGDALFASFLHAYARTNDARLSLRKAMVFASYKIGSVSASDGFLSEPELEDLFAKVG